MDLTTQSCLLGFCLPCLPDMSHFLPSTCEVGMPRGPFKGWARCSSGLFLSPLTSEQNQRNINIEQTLPYISQPRGRLPLIVIVLLSSSDSRKFRFPTVFSQSQFCSSRLCSSEPRKLSSSGTGEALQAPWQALSRARDK